MPVKKGFKNNYELNSLILIGSHGTIFSAKCLKTKNDVAVKIIKKSANGVLSYETFYDSIYREIYTLKQSEHENVIHLFDVYDDDNSIYIIMELCKGGDLYDEIIRQRNFSKNEKYAKNIIMQILKAIRHIHSKNIIHRDIKTENIVLSEDKKIPKLIDFGYAQVLCDNMSAFDKCGTIEYTAPEVWSSSYDKSCDMWSMGIVIFVMIFGFNPFNPYNHDLSNDTFYHKIRRGFIPVVRCNFGSWFPKDYPISSELRDLISKLIVIDCKKRLTASEALKHSWFG